MDKSDQAKHHNSNQSSRYRVARSISTRLLRADLHKIDDTNGVFSCSLIRYFCKFTLTRHH
jgi:hypothetical protein